MNPRLIAVLTLFFLTPIAPNKAEELTHVMACRVKDYVGLTATDGNVTRSTKPYEKWAEIGQTLLLSIQSGTPRSSNLFPVEFTFGGYDEEQNFMFAYSQLEDPEDIFVTIDNFGIKKVSPSGTRNVVPFSVGKNSISASFLLGNQTLNLKRYYKSDWNGIYNRSFFTDDDNGRTTESWALDCKTTSDRLDQLFERVQAEVGNADSSLDVVIKDEHLNGHSQGSVPSADFLEESIGTSYPDLPFDSSLAYLSTEFTKDQREKYLENMVEISLRCSGLFYLLGKKQLSDGITQDSPELQMAEVLLSVGGFWSFQGAFGDEYVKKSREDLESFIVNEISLRSSEYGETYAQWINTHGITVQDLTNKDHPFSQEFDHCHNFGSEVLEGSKLLQGD